ncbi:MAG: hypothetical protein JXM71_00405, partial [Spirochaetales bacterium]|nr:hypothetical protein [Spirochaetales bacterium]
AVRRIDNDVSLVVKDQGAGLPPDIDPMTSSTMGFTLVRSLAAQLKGTLSFGGPPGFEASLRFSVAKTPR